MVLTFFAEDYVNQLSLAHRIVHMNMQLTARTLFLLRPFLKYQCPYVLL